MIVESSPDSDSRNLMEAYFSMITNARREILIATPYFIPNESIMTALKTAAKSGVRVVLLLPERTDTRFVHAASLSFVPELLENDVSIYQYRKGMVHSKTIVVDEEISTVGSANMDYRSFDNNAEINAFFFDRGISRLLKAHFMQDLEASTILDMQRWKNTPRIQRLIGSAARLIAPLL
jgi:cardiolipin synthase